MEFTSFDIAVAFALAGCALAGFMAGLTRIVLSAGGWIGAAAVAAYGFDAAHPTMLGLVGAPLLADALTVVGLFTLSLILFTLVSQVVAGFVDASPLGAVNRSLGLIAGTMLGAAALSIAWASYDRLVLEGERPAWADAGHAVGALDHGVDLLREAAPSGWIEDAEDRAANVSDDLRAAESARDALTRLGLDPDLIGPGDTL
ncbi:MAG: CvpA family protein [Pseudomonadota bacterium]